MISITAIRILADKSYSNRWYRLLPGKGKSIQILSKGDVVNISRDVERWYGASPASEFTHIATNPNTQKGIVAWLERVTDKADNNFK